MNYTHRLSLLRRTLERESLDSILVTNETNVTYLTGFAGHDSMLLMAPRENFFLTDFRYVEEAGDSVKGFKIVRVKTSTYETICDLVRGAHARHIGFESMDLPVEVHSRLRRMLKGVRLAPLKNAIELLRQVKDRSEIAAVKRSAAFASSVLKKFLKTVRPGETEEELATRIKAALLREGSSSAFDPIVAVDANASRPHAVPGKTRVKGSCVLMVDLVARLSGYDSDMTRTTLFGRVRRKIRRIYDVVKRAQELALQAIRPGIEASRVDAAARNYIRSQGFEEYFGHALGHGVGMEVHEKPAIASHNHSPLEAGMIFTVEPAIYIPHLCGIRIEDMVLVTKRGCEVITGG
jgi:Xaa-Pro aminopeptidase